MDLTQAIKCQQQLLKEAGDGGNKIEVNFYVGENQTINQASSSQVNVEGEQKPRYFLAGEEPRTLAPPISGGECYDIEEETIQKMYEILKGLPEPIIANAMKLLYEASTLYDPVQTRCAEWIGMSQSTYSQNLKKFGVINE